MGTTGDGRTKGGHSALDSYREVIGLTGPLLPVVSFLGRLPTATVQFGSVLLIARTSGSLAAAGLVGGALAAGQVICGPPMGRLADRYGQRTVVLVLSLVNAVAVTALVAGALVGLPTAVLAALGAAAGCSVPLIGAMARTRLVALARQSGAADGTVGAALSFESTLDEISFVLGPALVGLAAVLAHPGYALGGAALLVAVCGSGFALHRTAAATGPGAPGAGPAPGTPETAPRQPYDRVGPATGLRAAPRGTRTARTRTARRRTGPARARTARSGIPRSVRALGVALVLQGAMFGACQAGIVALTERLGRPDQAGLVYAAMGVMSAVAGFAMAAVPGRVGLTTCWRAATGAAFVLSLPLLWTASLGGLYAVVTVLGVAYAPHLITVSGLIERAVPPERLAEAMAFATSAVIGGQALAAAVGGRLAESHGAAAAFAVVSTAAALAWATALVARPVTCPRPPKTPLHACVPRRTD